METCVTLNNAEMSIANYFGKLRYENARSKGIIDRRMAPPKMTNYEIDLEGFAAEMAFCKIANCYPDLDNRVDNGYDCVWQGRKVDVKTTRYKTGKLLATLKDNKNADLYVLMIGEFPTYRLAGVIEASEFLVERNIRDLGRGRGYCLEQKYLKELKDYDAR